MATWIDVVGYLAGAITAICFLPQIAHTLKTKSAHDVSLWMLLLTLLSVALYEIYAFALGLWPVMIMNGIFFFLVVVELYLKVVFTQKPKN